MLTDKTNISNLPKDGQIRAYISFALVAFKTKVAKQQWKNYVTENV